MIGEAPLPFLGEQQLGIFPDGHHVTFQLHHHTAVIFQFVKAAGNGRCRGIEAGIEVNAAVVIHQHTGVKGKLISFLPAPDGAILIMDVTIKPVGSGRFLCNGNANHPHKVKGIVQVKFPIRALHHIRRKQQTDAQSVFGVLVLLEDNPLIAPVLQVLHRSRPAHIVTHAENGGIKMVVGTVYINAVAKHTGLAIRDILPGGQIGIECLHMEYLSLQWFSFY